MKPWSSAAAALGVALCLTAGPAAAALDVGYDAPGADVDIARAHDVLVKNQVLEELQNFFAPLRMSETVNVRASACGAERRSYDPTTHTVTICYEGVARILKVAADRADADEDTRRTAVVGALVEDLLHETAYALFDVYHVPIWGRIEDAADRLAALVMTQFGEDNARTTILGAAMFFKWSSSNWSIAQLASTESPEAQRFFNFLCVAYGADPITFDSLRGAIPEYRLGRCGDEFQQVRKAFNLRIMPYVDPDKLVKARARQW